MAIRLVDSFRFSYAPIQRARSSRVETFRDKAADSFANRLLLSDGGAFLVTGYRGVGKTTFIHDVLDRLKAKLEGANSQQPKPPQLLDVYLNIARPLTGVELMHYILRQLHTRLADLKLLEQLPRDLRSQLRLAFLRTSAMLVLSDQEGTESSLSFEKWLNFSTKVTSGKSRDINYLAYDERSAEADLIGIAKQLVRGFRPAGWYGLRGLVGGNKRLKLLFVFDELDKIDESATHESSLTNILHSLKTLFTTSGISFIFVAGRALHDRWQADIQRGDSVYESVFSQSRYIPAIWDQIEDICDPFLQDAAALSDYDKALYEDFKRYLAFSGRGIPRRILRGFYERVHWDGTTLSLQLSPKDQRQVRFHAELFHLLRKSENQILGERSGELRPDWLDRQRLGLYYVLDWILGRGLRAFTIKQLIDASLALQKGIALDPDVAPLVVDNLVNLLLDHKYLARVPGAETTTLAPTPTSTPTTGTGSGDTPEQYQLQKRRLIEMGTFSESSEIQDAAESGKTLQERYQLLNPLGSGASSQVFKALDNHTGRLVAIKLFSHVFASESSSLKQRLEEEVRVQRQLTHPAIVAFHDVETEAERPFIVMEYVDGRNLFRILRQRGRLSPDTALSLIRKILVALAYLHAKGVLWRDIKPSNVMVTRTGEVKIIDFGTAQTLESAMSGPDTTRIGFAAGTPAYMSPEGLAGQPLTPASDIFSIGVLFYEMLTGVHPWPGRTWTEVLEQIKSAQYLENAQFLGLPEDYRVLIRKSLHPDPEQRYQCIEDLESDLPPQTRSTKLSELLAWETDKFPPEQVSPATDEEYFNTQVVNLSNDRVSAEVTPQDNADLTPRPGRSAFSATGPCFVPPPTPTGSPATASGYMQGHRSTVSVIEEPGSMTQPRGYPLLRIESGGVSQLMGLFAEEITLGRSEDCDIVLHDPTASRYQARIKRQEEKFEIIDLNSTNGLLVNNQPIYQRSSLQDGDVITIGTTTLHFSTPQV